MHYISAHKSPVLNTGCGRKNSPIWEGHSFRWGGRTVVGSASSNSGVRAVFSVHHGVVGRTSSLYYWGVYKNGGSPVATQWPPHSPDLTPCDYFSLGLPESKGLRTTSPNFGSSAGGDTTGSCCHYTWNDSQGHGQLPREATSVYQYSRPALEWCFVQNTLM